ncbi:MAG: helix-turn-helix domain-containing protein [Candidatus Aminicenantes bacterium]|nr:helix-turn-helix domain-containing protein [Candidatus Aminicenantes bacterium]
MEKILGLALKKEREMRGISLADIANETRIGTRYLQALENEDFDVFSGIFYIRYYIKNYLHACGADEAAFFNAHFDYLKAVLDRKGTPPPDQFLNKLEYVKFKKRKTFLIILLLILTGAFVFWLFGGSLPLPNRSERFEFPAFSATLLSGERDFCLNWAPVSIRMTFAASCWLQLWRGNEKKVEKIFARGDSLFAQGYQLALVMGNPAAVRLKINGRGWTPASQPRNGVKLLLSPDKVQEITL